MAKKGPAGRKTKSGYSEHLEAMEKALTHRAAGRPSALLDPRVIYCGDNFHILRRYVDIATTLVLVILTQTGCASAERSKIVNDDAGVGVSAEWRPSEWQYGYWSYIALGHSHDEAAKLAGRGMEQHEIHRRQFELLTPGQRQASRDDADAKFKTWQRAYWSSFDEHSADGHERAASRAGAMLQFSGESSRRRFEALTPAQVVASRQECLLARAYESRAQAERERKLVEWERHYQNYVSAGWRHADAADMARRLTGDDLRAEYENKQGQIEHRVKQKEWNRWYDTFIRDGYTPEEATYKANQLVH